MKGNVILEVRENYYVIDIESLQSLEEKYYDYFKEENFEDLNDYYYYNILNRQESCSRDFSKVPSKLSQKSSQKDSCEVKEMGVMELALLNSPKQLAFKGNRVKFIKNI